MTITSCKAVLVSICSIAAFSSFTFTAHAEQLVSSAPGLVEDSAIDTSALDELDPFDPNVDAQLKDMDDRYESETGQSPFVFKMPQFFSNGCQLQQCAVFIDVVKSEQRAYLYVNGAQQNVWKVSTGVPGRGTPDFSKKPDGRIYNAYTSGKYPGGDYNGLGNMPYAVFIKGGFAIHGTGKSNWKYLGRPASHGCIRLHPDNAKIFNGLVRENGIDNVWIRVR